MKKGKVLKMATDIFTEHMVRKKHGGSDTINSVLLTLAAAGLFLLLLLVGLSVTGLLAIIALAEIGLVYGWYILITSFNIEFEYIFTNGEMDVDKIIARRRRKRLITINFKEIEIMAPLKGEYAAEAKRSGIRTKIDASASPDSEDTYFLVANHKKMGLTLLLFQPSGEIIRAAETYAPRKIFKA